MHSAAPRPSPHHDRVPYNRRMHLRDVLIIGAGPSGLATAIAAKQLGLDYQVLEKGVLVNSIFRYPVNMVFFTTPELLEIGGLPLVTPYEKPTRLEALRYYRRVVDTYDLQVLMQEEVLSIEREEGEAPGEMIFAVESRSARGVRRARHARYLVIAIGYFDLPNRLDVPGEDLPHVAHYYTEAHPYYRQRVVIVGGKNSAVEAALELHRQGVHVTIVHRGPAIGDSVKYWVKPDIENRIREGSIAARFDTVVREIRPTTVVVESEGRTEEIAADAVLLLTGYHPDYGFFERAGVELDPETRGVIHDPYTFETRVPNLFVAGGCLAGKRTGTVFIENGRFHGESIARTIAARAVGSGSGQ